MDVRDGDLAYRINFASCDWPEIVDRRVGRSLTSEESHALADEVNAKLVLSGATFDLRATIEHRGALVIRSDTPLSANVTNTDPAYARDGHMGVALETFDMHVVTAEPLDGTEAAGRAADLTNAFVEGAAKVLDASEVNARRRAAGSLPANLILTRDGGDRLPRLEPIEQRFGMRWGCFVEMPVERGIAMALAMTPVDVPRLDLAGFGPAAEEAYAAWAHLAAEALGSFDALYVHLKGPDVPAHDGRARDKRDVVSAIDRAFFGEVLARIDSGNTIVAVTGDHSTSCLRAAHTADPVPLLVSGGPVRPDGSEAFGERACAAGSLGELPGPRILPRLAELILRD
jgi:2,3-bisphosphoglycerate-independent phosphoglycerate mutase